MTEEEQEFINADEVAKWLGLDRKTVYDSANRGEMPCRKFGRRVLFSRSAILKWFESSDSMVESEA